jgi:hypothetical protein
VTHLLSGNGAEQVLVPPGACTDVASAFAICILVNCRAAGAISLSVTPVPLFGLLQRLSLVSLPGLALDLYCCRGQVRFRRLEGFEESMPLAAIAVLSAFTVVLAQKL